MEGEKEGGRWKKIREAQSKRTGKGEGVTEKGENGAMGWVDEKEN